VSAKSEHIELLGRIPLFSGCSKNELRAIASLTTEVDFQAGSVLTRQGDPGDECFVIVEGSVEVSIDDRVLAELGAGQVVGEMSLLDQGPRTATVTAKTGVKVLVLNPLEFMSMLDSSPGVAKKLLRSLAQRLRAVESARN
jgi:CRP-like cAMP-binding protein